MLDIRRYVDEPVLAVDRVAGGSKKGVYRVRRPHADPVVLYVWTDEENWWPPGPVVPDDPFTDANSPELFYAAHQVLSDAGVRVPRLLRRGTGFALVEDAGGTKLEDDLTAETAGRLAATLRAMHAATATHYGKVGRPRENTRPAEDVVVARTTAMLDAAAARDARMAAAYTRIAAHLARLREPVRPRREYRLVHGELGPDHVLLAPDGAPVLIDIEGLAFFDVEWEHAFLRLRFGDAYRWLDPPPLDETRVALYTYAQTLSLVEGPLRIAATDFPGRDWMRELAEWNIGRAIREAS